MRSLSAISRRLADKLTAENPEIKARMVTLAGAIVAIGPVAVPAGACARTVAPFKDPNKRNDV